jgi:arsenite methyltransferase
MTAPEWFWDFLGTQALVEEARAEIRGQTVIQKGGVPRVESLVSDAQAQTREAFGFKWEKRDTFESDASLLRMRNWLNERYGQIDEFGWLDGLAANPIVLDAGCGAGMSGLEYFGPVMDRIRYVGADVSTAVDVAAARFSERGLSAGFIQADLTGLPLAPGAVDLIFSEGVLHHTDSTRGALASLVPLLADGGRFLFYVYRKKGPVREFTDDYIRDLMEELSPEDGWRQTEALSKLGRTLGELDIEIEIDEPIDLLQIPAGKINLQRFFYWHVAKVFYRPELTLDEMNHIDFDWFAPRNAHRQTVEEVRAWCAELGLEVEREVAEEAGITVVARKP